MRSAVRRLPSTSVSARGPAAAGPSTFRAPPLARRTTNYDQPPRTDPRSPRPSRPTSRPASHAQPHRSSTQATTSNYNDPPPPLKEHNPPARLPLHPIHHSPPGGNQVLLRPPIALHLLSQPPHFPYSLSILGSLLAPAVSHNALRSSDSWWADSRAVREQREKMMEEWRAARAKGESYAYEARLQPTRDSLHLPLAQPWKDEQRRLSRPKRWATLAGNVAWPHAQFGERYFLWRGRFPVARRRGSRFPGDSAGYGPVGGQRGDRGEVGEAEEGGEGWQGLEDDPSSHWAILTADVDSGPLPSSPSSPNSPTSPRSSQGGELVDLRFYSSDEAWLLLESGGWAYDPSTGRLRDSGAAQITNTLIEEDDHEGKMRAGRAFHAAREAAEAGEVEQGAGEVNEQLGMVWFQGQQILAGALNEWSQMGRPLRINSISQLWVPTLRKIASYLRIRPRSVKITYYTRWALPAHSPLLLASSSALAAEQEQVERALGMQLGTLHRRELADLSAPLRQTPKYIERSLPFSSALRPVLDSSSSLDAGTASVLYGAQTVNTDLSLASPLILPQYAHAGLQGLLMGRTARLLHRGMTQTVDEASQAKDLLSSLLPHSLPLHAKIPVQDQLTAGYLRASGWREVYGGVADVELGEWEEVSDQQFQMERAERKTGLTLEERERLRESKQLRWEEERAMRLEAKREARRVAGGAGEDGEGEEDEAGGEETREERWERMRKSVRGVFSHPSKPNKWDI